VPTVFKPRAERVLRLFQDAAVGRDRAFPVLQAALPTADALRCIFSPFSSFVPYESTEFDSRAPWKGIFRNDLVEKALPKDMSPALQDVSHRPWPLPTGPWVMAQSWHDLLFAHWPVDIAALRLFFHRGYRSTLWIPAWLAVVPFRMTGVRSAEPLPCLGSRLQN